MTVSPTATRTASQNPSPPPSLSSSSLSPSPCPRLPDGGRGGRATDRSAAARSPDLLSRGGPAPCGPAPCGRQRYVSDTASVRHPCAEKAARKHVEVRGKGRGWLYQLSPARSHGSPRRSHGGAPRRWESAHGQRARPQPQSQRNTRRAKGGGDEGKVVVMPKNQSCPPPFWEESDDEKCVGIRV